MGVTIRTSEVRRTLDDALVLGRDFESALVADGSLRNWSDRVRHLQQEAVPKTYLPVAVTLLTARAMFGPQVDVTLLQARVADNAYAASTVANALSGFAKGNGLDLRATSSAPFNNHPFTFVQRLDDVEPGVRNWLPFMALRDTANAINAMSAEEAKRALALTTILCRRQRRAAATVTVHPGRARFKSACAALAGFVAARPDEGRTGQALCAALLDLQHENVLLGLINDPDARLPGDVHAIAGEQPWLWCEVKQKPIVIGDVISFMRKVSDSGGQRCLYLALAQGSDDLDPRAIKGAADDFHLDVTVVRSAGEAIELLTRFVPGEQGDVAGRLLERMRIRLVESAGSAAVLAELDDLIRTHGELRIEE